MSCVYISICFCLEYISLVPLVITCVFNTNYSLGHSQVTLLHSYTSGECPFILKEFQFLYRRFLMVFAKHCIKYSFPCYVHLLVFFSLLDAFRRFLLHVVGNLLIVRRLLNSFQSFVLKGRKL